MPIPILLFSLLEENSSEHLAVRIEVESLSELHGFGHPRFGADRGTGCPISIKFCNGKHIIPILDTKGFLCILSHQGKPSIFLMNAFYSLSSQTQSWVSTHTLNVILKTLRLGAVPNFSAYWFTVLPSYTLLMPPSTRRGNEGTYCASVVCGTWFSFCYLTWPSKEPGEAGL